MTASLSDTRIEQIRERWTDSFSTPVSGASADISHLLSIIDEQKARIEELEREVESRIKAPEGLVERTSLGHE